MASKKEIEAHLKIALKEIGKIKPRFSKKFHVWLFKHKAYPDVEYAGDTQEEVIKNYPKYLREFIKQRLDQNISLHVELKTTGRGGRREGAGRPKGTKKDPTKRVSLPLDVVKWFDRPEAIPQFRRWVAREKI
jgi:hypothetical protein